MDSPPNAARAAATQAVGKAAVVTSPANGDAVPPAFLISAATASALPPSRSATNTLAPWAANRRAAAAPRPWPAPVMMAT